MKITIKQDSIKKATPLFPHLMHECAESLLIADYEALQRKKRDLQEARNKVLKLEQEVTAMQENFNKQAAIFNIEWETIEKEIIDSDNSQTGDVINRAREKH